MAQNVKIEMVSDLDDSPADETVSFALDGQAFEIDLTTAQAADLRDVLNPFFTKARRVAGAKSVKGSKKDRTDDSSAIRAWARSVGREINDRGRIAADVRDAYVAAGSPTV